MDTQFRLSRVTLVLHWFVALSMMGLIGLGVYMTEFEKWDLYPIHKSVGLLVVAVILLRVLWRVKNGWPKHVADYTRAEVLMAKVIHWVLIISTVTMPIWGMMYSGASGHGFGVFGLEIFHSNHSPTDPNVAIPISEFWSDFSQTAHHYNGNAFIAAIILHVVGAYKHHLVDKDSTLTRMLGREAV